MATAILFRSYHGTTLKVSKIIQESLHDEIVDLFNLRHYKSLNIENYDTIIIGGSIHYGKLQSDLKRLVAQKKEELLDKNLALFLCCMEEKPRSTHQFNSAFPLELREHSVCNAIMGGEFLLEKMNFIDKLSVNRLTKLEKSVSNIKFDEIDKLTDILNQKQLLIAH